jgi:hypothetical protein
VAAAEKHAYPPLIDGSIRREPDLQHRYPSISCLCRAGKFAPRLKVGDIIGYITAKRRYDGAPKPLRYLTAILQVRKVCGSHQEAAAWYRRKKQELPNNCMARRNPAKPLNHSHKLHRDWGCFGPSNLRCRWDRRYLKRAVRYPTFIICNCLFRSLQTTAPIVTDSTLRRIFGHLPSTQNPWQYKGKVFRRFVTYVNLPLRGKVVGFVGPRHASPSVALL